MFIDKINCLIEKNIDEKNYLFNENIDLFIENIFFHGTIDLFNEQIRDSS